MTRTRDSATNSSAREKTTRRCFTSSRRPQSSAASSSLRTALACVLWSWSSTAIAYRTAADLREFEDLTTVDGTSPIIGWANPKVAFRLHAEAPPGLGIEDVARAVNRATDTWNTPICSALRLTLSGTTSQSARPGDSINTIQFVTDWSALGFSSRVGAVTDIQYAEQSAAEGATATRWVIGEADIYLDAQNYEWVLEVANDSDERKSLLSVLTHELGHAAGLLHPCETENTRDTSGASADPNAPLCGDIPGAEETLLYPEYAPTLTALSADDRAGLCFLYAQDSCETLGCPTGELCTDHGCMPACGDEVCAADQTCFQDECVPLCSGLDCYVGQECGKTSDCPNFLRCRTALPDPVSSDAEEDTPEKVCLPGDAPLGDPCDSSRDCASAACSKDGFCVPPCETDEDCSASATCEKSQGSVKGCVGGSLHGMGQECNESNECLGNQCVSGRTPAPICTRECSINTESSNTEPCPAGFSCGAAVTDGQERTVCLPPAEATSCSVARATTIGAAPSSRVDSSARPFTLLGAASALSLIVHFARRRRPRVHST